MKTKQNELYEAPEVIVLELEAREPLLSQSQNDPYSNGGNPFA